MAQEYRSALCEFHSMLASWQCIFSPSPAFTQQTGICQQRRVRSKMQTQHSLERKKWMRREGAASSIMWSETVLISVSTSRLEWRMRGYFKWTRSCSCPVVQKKKKLCLCSLGFKRMGLGIYLWKRRESSMSAHILLCCRAGSWLGVPPDIEREFCFCSLNRTKSSFLSFSHLVLHGIC